MQAARIVACLDVDAGRVLKGVRFEGLRDRGDPALLARRYAQEGADEIVLLDVGASVQSRPTDLEVVQRVARSCPIPLTVGGGIRSVEDAWRVLRSGADKVAVNAASLRDPTLLARIAQALGSQSLVAAIDCRRIPTEGPLHFEVFTHSGRIPTGWEVREWARRVQEEGAGEILLTSIDRDGTRSGYDVELTRSVVQEVRIPVIASGGAGSVEDVRSVLLEAGADAALLAGVLHEGTLSISHLKEELHRAGLPIRWGWSP